MAPEVLRTRPTGWLTRLRQSSIVHRMVVFKPSDRGTRDPSHPGAMPAPQHVTVAPTVGLAAAWSARTQADQATMTRRAEYLPVNRMSAAAPPRGAPPKSIADHATALVLGKGEMQPVPTPTSSPISVTREMSSQTGELP